MATMSANAVLMKFFKLPPAMRMILALAGFGSLATILFTVLPALRTRQGRMWVLLIAGIGLVLFLLIWGIRRLIWGKKSSQLAGALESQGPTRGDIAEQEQIYREKFRNKLAELKTNGLSVYKLPWFMLIGEPGCGKTASLIHSGLDFPLGKDEVPGFGGTRNYNWWFTNEAVILDTAGRIAFHEEGTTDKVEWEYFCKLIKQNRTRCPINGMIIALPADKLLRDSADERMQKAAVLRERLRQIHQLLGVRFPTFVLVTKMDLVGGFSEFFEEIRVDLAQRNQMFGWSRPGEFQEPYDPSTFPEAFDSVYHRLRDWAMRYLQRKATEDELGMIVTFPEAFRQLRDGLNDYISTIFQKSPLLEPPFFRGFYFTSAVQEGAPILDVFARTSTHRVSERPAKAVDSKAFFIHDFYTKKVFPEQGLVFRSAKHVSLNKRMRRLVWIGSAAMFVLMIGMFALGWAGTRKLIDNPKADCKNAHELITQAKDEPKFKDFSKNLELAQRLKQHYDAYSGGWNALYARALYIFANISQPQRDVGAIHARFVIDELLVPVLREAERKFESVDLKGGLSPEARKRYMDALAVYTQWYGEVVGAQAVEPLQGQLVNRRREFDALLRFVIDEGEQMRSDAGAQFDAALAFLSESPRAFGRDVLGKTAKFATGEQNLKRATDTIVHAAEKITDYWRRLAEISDKNQHEWVSYWARFTDLVGALRERYLQVTSLAAAIGRPDGYEEARREFLRLTEGAEYLGNPQYSSDPGTLKRALDDLANFLEEHEPPQKDGYIIRLGQLLGEFEKQWSVEYQPLINALKVGAPDETAEPQARVYAALRGGQQSLADAFRASLKLIRDQLGIEVDAEPLDYFEQQGLVEKKESQEGRILDRASVRLANNLFGTHDEFKHYLLEMRQAVAGEGVGEEALNDLRRWPSLLEGIASDLPQGEYLAIWFGDVRQRAPDRQPDPQLLVDYSKLKNRPFWRPADLYRLAQQIWIGRRAVSVEGVLGRMVAKADETTRAATLPGLGRLLPGFDQPPTPALPFNRHKYNSAAPAPAQPELRQPQPQPEPEQPAQTNPGGLPRLGAAPPKPKPTETAAPPSGAGVPDVRGVPAVRQDQDLMLAYHTREFLASALSEAEKLKKLLAARGDEGQQVIAALDRAADAYIDGYFRDWYELSGKPKELLDQDTLELLERCRDGALDWPKFVEAVTNRYRNIGVALGTRMEALCDHAVLYSLAFPPDGGPLDAAYARVARWHDTHRDVSIAQQQAQMFQNLPPDGGAAAAKAFGGAISGAWNQYVNQVAALGPLTGESRTLQPPDLAQLRDNIVYRQAYRTDFPLVAPLVDLAEYGQELLKHHVQAELAKVFAAHAGEYPLVSRAAVDGYDYGSIFSMRRMDPQAFLDLLRKAEAFRTRFLELYESLEPGSGAKEALDACRAWTRFLYDNPADLLANRPPSPCPVWLVVVAPGAVERQAYASMGIGYGNMEISVPLLTTSRTRPAPIRIETKTSAGNNAFKRSVTEALNALPGPNYTWSLMDSPSVLPEAYVKLSDRNPDMADRFPETARGFTLPADPWTIPMLLGARSNNKLANDLWQIPVAISIGKESVGCVIGIKLGRPFPGTTIPPLQYRGAAPKMVAASRYFSGD
ncbi:MAG: hypothetical protein D6744_00800 [Planctomycetota bacterium]|nr:MAG: hypothetical protein D6744_00800 [Planctomycetota bacterium]